MPTDGVMDFVVRLFGASASGILSSLISITLALFVLLATIQATWDLLMWAIHDDPNILGKALRRFLLISLHYLLIVALPLWLPQLLAGFEYLGQEVTGLPGLSPSSLFEQGVALSLTVFGSWKKLLLTVIPFAGALQLVTFLAILVSFSLMAFQLARVLVEASLVLGGMVFFLAGAGHRLTYGLFEGYFRYGIDVGIRVYLVYILISIGQNLGTQWDAIVRDATLLQLADPRFHLAIPAAAALYAFIVWTLPKTISARLMESFSFSGHNPLADSR